MPHGFQGLILFTGTVIVLVSWVITKFILKLLRLGDREGGPPSPMKDFAVMVFAVLTFAMVTTALAFAACGSFMSPRHTTQSPP